MRERGTRPRTAGSRASLSADPAQGLADPSSCLGCDLACTAARKRSPINGVWEVPISDPAVLLPLTFAQPALRP